MKHSEFVEAYNTGKIAVHVDKNRAGFIYEDPYLLPQSVRSRQAKFRSLFFGLVIIGLVLFFFVKWQIALLVLVVGLLFSRKAQSDTAKGVLESALKSESVLHAAIETNVVRIQTKDIAP